MTIFLNTSSGKATIAKKKPKNFFKKTTTKKLSKKVNRLIRSIEKKHFDKNIGIDFANDTSPLSASLFSQGDTSSQRTGLKVYAKNMIMHYTVTWADTAAQETNVRLLVFLDRNSQGAVPSNTDLLESAETDSLYNNINEGRRFIVLLDKHISNHNVTTTVPKSQAGSLKIPINRNIWFLDSTATASGLGRNQIYILPLGDVTNTHVDAARLDANMRLYFEDL